MNSADLKISIITVCLNSENHIEKTIQSVLGQTYPHIEYIIIDGNSSDNTWNLINKYRENIDKLLSEKDEGIYYAMNKGLTLATGDIIYFLNSGDLLYDDSIIEKIVHFFIENPESPMVYGDLVFYSDRMNRYLSNNRWGDPAEFLIQGTSHQSLFVRKELFKRIGQFNTHFTILADKDWLLRSILDEGLQITYLQLPVAYFLAGGISCQYRDQYFFEDSNIIKRYLNNSLIKKSIRSNPVKCIRILSIILFLELNKISIKLFHKNFAGYLKRAKEVCCKY